MSQAKVQPSFAETIRRQQTPVLHRYAVSVSGLDPAHDGLRIAHLSDLHVGSLTSHRFIRNAIETALLEQPDLVLMTGDFVCYSPKYVPLLGNLVSGFAVPTVCVLGNHDYWTDGHGVAAQLVHEQYTVLRNQHTRLSVRGAPLTIVGLDDAVTRQHDVARAFQGVHPQDSRIVLSHVPSLVVPISEREGGLVLAGHTHGGHVQIPGLTDLVFRRLGQEYVRGFYRVKNTLLYVNSGVGSSSVPIRAGAPAEVAILTLKSAGASSTGDVSPMEQHQRP
ncbi:MAG TPA: metallophosphoesterase [Pseudomonadota bacterium]|jgi:predicted MPP superfamily phosphohydrolase|nr:metallophosphoesterase [Pseudomonadota bacterium]